MKNDKHKRSTKSSKAEAKQRNEQSALKVPIMRSLGSFMN
jgi:hypothetical protein